MKKRVLAMTLAAVMALGSMAGCGSEAAPEAESAAPAESAVQEAAAAETEEASEPVQEPVEMETITVWSDANHDREIRDRQIAEFNEGVGKELGIYIDYQTYGTKYSDTIKIAAQADEAPDLFRADGKFMSEFVESGYVVPIEDLPGSEELLAKYDGMLTKQSQVFNGKTYTLPYNVTTYGFVINEDLFEECGLTEEDYPTTWEEVRNVAKIITEKSNGKAYGLGLSGTLWTVSSFYTFGAGQNIGHIGYDWNAKQFNFSAYNPMVEAIDQIVADGSAFPGFEALDGDAIRAQFAAGTIGMIGSASFDCAVYTNDFPANFRWKVLPVPKFSEDQKEYKRFGLATNLLCVGTKAMEHPEKVLKVLEFFYDDENSAEMYENGLYIPVRSEAVKLATKTPDMNGWAEFAEFDDIFLPPSSPESEAKVEGTTYREAMMNMWANPELDDVEAVMAELDQRYNDALAKLDPSILEECVLPEGISPEIGK